MQACRLLHWESRNLNQFRIYFSQIIKEWSSLSQFSTDLRINFSKEIQMKWKVQKKQHISHEFIRKNKIKLKKLSYLTLVTKKNQKSLQYLKNEKQLILRLQITLMWV